MLAIRMQRTGRKGHTQFRVVVQDSRFSPGSGRVVAYLGSYNPHSKTTTLDKEKVQTYLGNGAQPSDRVAMLLKKEGLKLPNWVSEPTTRSRNIRNQDKLRRNRPAEEVTQESTAEETAVEEAPAAEPAPAEENAPAEETPVSEPEAPAEPAPAADEAAEESAPEA